MIAVDTNLLVYAHRRDSEWHAKAFRILRDLAEGSAPWGVPLPCFHEFLSIVTHPRIYKPPTPVVQAIQQVDFWMESPSLRLIGEMARHWHELKKILSAGRITGGGVHDGRVAAICLENGIRVLWSADRDFHRIAGLAVRNPLVQ
jgi:toxin-antitoxin system PIN domain toxin